MTHIGNAYYDLLLACIESSDSVQDQQVADTNTTRQAGLYEMNLNNFYYNNPDSTNVNVPSYWTNLITQETNSNDSNTDKNNKITAYQADYQAACTGATNMTNAINSLMQSDNSMTSTDATNDNQIITLCKSADIMNFIMKLLSKK